MKKQMKFAVCIKMVPSYDELSVQDCKDGSIDRSKLKMKMNPDDRCALQTALNLKKQFGGEVTVISMGPQAAEQIIREAYALGADNGCLLCDKLFAGADVLATAEALSAAVRTLNGFDMILCGKRTLDGGTGETAGELAFKLGYEYIYGVQSLTVKEERAVITRTIDGLHQTLLCDMPLVASVEPMVVELPIPSLKEQLMSRKKEVTLLNASAFKQLKADKVGRAGSATSVKKIYTSNTVGRETVWINNAAAAVNEILKYAERR